jgi:hypothetical protein
MSEQLCSRCKHPQSWHRHDDEGCSEHPQPCHPSTAPFRCLGYDCVRPDGMPKTRCGCPDYVAASRDSQKDAR